MKASETTLQSVIEGSKQYIVPLYQRSYSWEKKQWAALWDDLVETCEDDGPRSHFLGSLVTMQTASVPEGVPKYFLIDGQQRLTTIFILLALLRDTARERGEAELADEIETLLLVNSYKKGNEYFKILPTQGDRGPFQAIVRGEEVDAGSAVVLAYRFFEAKLRGKGPDVPALKRAITERLSVVSIVLDRDDNPYLVFESLNAKGAPLTQADLIRNFFFLKIHVDQQDDMHDRYWRPMQDALGESLTEFIRHYLTRQQGAFVRKDSVYFTLKERLGSGDAIALLKDLARFAEHYRRLLDPEQEPDERLREALKRLNRFELKTAYPFLLNACDEREAGTLSVDDFALVVADLENYIVRRFVCNVPTNQLNKIFPPLYNQIKAAGHARLLDGLREVLPSKGYPKDNVFRARLVDARLYGGGGGDRRDRTKFLLEAIERSHGHKERLDFDRVNIEHVMPQTLSDAWRESLGEECDATHQLLLDTLGNLTLTGYNSELSNSTFAAKKPLFARSNVEMNAYFADLGMWTGDEIERRGEALAEVALGIWPSLGDEPQPAAADEAARDVPISLRFLGRVHPVTTWRDVLAATLNALGEDDPDLLDGVAADLPSLLSRDPGAFRSRRAIARDYYFNTHGSARTINRWCERILDSAGLTSDDWEVELAGQPHPAG